MSSPVASYLETNFPCRAACPVNTNAGGYVSLIAQGRYREAYLLARAPNPLASVCGRVCAHPCEAACRRGQIDTPIAIRAMKRVVTERFGVESRASFDEIARVVDRPRPPADRPGRVAVIGAGPAGLACAHDLALMGHRAVVFDAAPVVGGMMRLGIPAYRLPRELVDREVEFIRHLGVEFRLGVEIGRDILFRQLRDEFDAVFIAAGCRKGKMLRLPGADLPGVLTAVDFLANVNLGVPLEVGRRVVVVGGGNVAFDVARSARRFGGTTQPGEEHHQLAVDAAIVAARLLRRDVTLVSLESREEMPADPEEIEEGSHEGIRLVHRRGPKAIVGNGRVRALQTVDVARVFDASGRFAPEFVADSEQEIPCDTVILAVGQIADLGFLGDTSGLAVTPQQTIVVDAHLATSLPGVYAGGDIAFGPRILISAVADGRKAARSIDTCLTGRLDSPPSYAVRVFPAFGYDHPFARAGAEAPRGGAAHRAPAGARRSGAAALGGRGARGGKPLPALLGEHHLRLLGRARQRVHPVRGLRRRLSRAVHRAGVGRADRRGDDRGAGAFAERRAGGVGRGAQRRAAPQGRNRLHPLRPVRAPLSDLVHHDAGVLPCGRSGRHADGRCGHVSLCTS